MEFSLDCYPCAVRHALQGVRKSGMNEEMHEAVMQRVLRNLASLKSGSTSPEIFAETYAIIREVTGVEDIFKKEKEESTREAMAYYAEMKEKIQQSSDPFETAVRLSVAGNIIDYGSLDSYDLSDSIQRVLEQPFAIDDLEALREAVDRTDQILYLADNAGETVFDRLLIETMQKPVVYAVKDGPILNDAIQEDAIAAGLDKVAEIVSCGARASGTVLNQCSSEFIDRFNKARVIIAKGMGNYETLSSVKAPVFFLLQIKCEMVGRDIGAPVGSIVVAKNRA